MKLDGGEKDRRMETDGGLANKRFMKNLLGLAVFFLLITTIYGYSTRILVYTISGVIFALMFYYGWPIDIQKQIPSINAQKAAAASSIGLVTAIVGTIGFLFLFPQFRTYPKSVRRIVFLSVLFGSYLVGCALGYFHFKTKKIDKGMMERRT